MPEVIEEAVPGGKGIPFEPASARPLLEDRQLDRPVEGSRQRRRVPGERVQHLTPAAAHILSPGRHEALAGVPLDLLEVVALDVDRSHRLAPSHIRADRTSRVRHVSPHRLERLDELDFRARTQAGFDELEDQCGRADPQVVRQMGAEALSRHHMEAVIACPGERFLFRVEDGSGTGDDIVEVCYAG